MEKIQLDKASFLPEGFQKNSYPLESFDLRPELIRLLIDKGFIEEPVSLEKLHLYISKENQRANEYDGLNKVSKAFYETSETYQGIYLKLVNYVATNILKFDFIFQTTPTIRFHFPNSFSEIRYKSSDGTIMTHHNDAMLGHPFEEINCWLPLTECYGTNSLQLASLGESNRILNYFCQEFDFDAEIYHSQGRERFFDKLCADGEFKKLVLTSVLPVKTVQGEVIFFDSRCIHTTAENVEDGTRISMDFRLIPLQVYESMTRTYKSAGRSGRLFARGDVFSEKSAFEV
jgi:hypothetical protein